MNKKITLGFIAGLAIIYFLVQLDIRVPKSGLIADQEGKPIANADIIYMVENIHPNPGGQTTGYTICRQIKSDTNGIFKLPTTFSWSPNPFYSTEQYLKISKGAEYKARSISLENYYSDYWIKDDKLNKPIILERIYDLENLTSDVDTRCPR